MTTQTGPDSVISLPAPYAENAILRESLWYEFARGVDSPAPPAWLEQQDPPMDDHVPPRLQWSGPHWELPADISARCPAVFPHGLAAEESADPWRVERAIVTSCAPQWWDGDNPYQVHRPYASPRTAYPVQVFVERRGTWSHVDLDHHELVGVDRHAVAPSAGPVTRIAMVGHYPRIPSGYKWLRSSLVNYELGIVLRALAIGLGIHALPSDTQWPSTETAELLQRLRLPNVAEWSLPVVLRLSSAVGPDSDGPTTETTAPVTESAHPDPSLRDLVQANRAQRFTAQDAPTGSGVPDGVPTSSRRWTEVLWSRNSGRMPRALHGMGARPAPVPADVIDRQLAWLTTRIPGFETELVRRSVNCQVALRGVRGRSDGLYSLDGDSLRLDVADPDILDILESLYGYAPSPGAGCDIHHANAVWFMTVRPRPLVAEFGAAGWSAIQYATGWAVHGATLAAAADGLFCRPTRAFREEPTLEVLGRPRDELIALSAIVGHARHGAPRLVDLRR